MADRAAARRYAEAYVRSLESASLEGGLKQLAAVAKTYTGSRELQRFLGSPEIATEEKERLLTRLFGDWVGPQGMGFLILLLKRDRMDHLPVIEEEARQVAEEAQGILRGRVLTARPISSSETQALARAASQLLGKKVLLKQELDPQLIGGIRLVMGSTVLDGSLATLLAQIRRQLLEAKVA